MRELTDMEYESLVAEVNNLGDPPPFETAVAITFYRGYVNNPARGTHPFVSLIDSQMDCESANGSICFSRDRNSFIVYETGHNYEPRVGTSADGSPYVYTSPIGMSDFHFEFELDRILPDGWYERLMAAFMLRSIPDPAVRTNIWIKENGHVVGEPDTELP